MKLAEAKKYLFRKGKVKHKEIVYDHISALIFKTDEKNQVYTLCELTDENLNSVTIARLEDVNVYYENQ